MTGRAFWSVTDRPSSEGCYWIPCGTNRSRYGAVGVVGPPTVGTARALPRGIGVEFQLSVEAFREESKNALYRTFLTSFSLLHASRRARSMPGNFNYVFRGEQRTTERIQPPASVIEPNCSFM